MRIGLQIPDFTWPGGPPELGPTLRRIARDAEDAGMASLWLMDHFFQISMVAPAENDMLESWSALAHVAAVTERISLGTMVTGVTYRHPGVLVKTATTLDVLSGGRAWFGVGAAWNEEEHRGLGVPYPALSERFERLEETLRIAHRMWRGDESPFDGTHYRLERPLNVPQALSDPHPRVLVGGTGEKKTLRLVAQYADACNIFELGVEGVQGKLDVLRGHCEAQGRDYADIERTTLGLLSLSTDGGDGSQTVQQAVERFAAYAAIGVDHAVVSMPDVSDPAAWELVPDLVAELGKITPAGR
ncbi:MAG: LLM class F420-dependent oxidoreductase [Kineosporiaceae bacterium]